MSDYADLTVAELKELLKGRGLTVSGKKADLIGRLLEHDSVDSSLDSDVIEDIEDVVDDEMVSEVGDDVPESDGLDDSHDDESVDDDDFDDDDFDDDFDEWDDDDEPHTARQKAELSDETRAALEMRAEQKRRTPSFRRQEWFRYKRLSRTGWRRPKGLHSKQRLNKKYRGARVRIGHRKVTTVRHLHPSGFREIMVHRPEDLEAIDPATEAARIGSTVGGRKRERIHLSADELGIRILNRRNL